MTDTGAAPGTLGLAAPLALTAGFALGALGRRGPSSPLHGRRATTSADAGRREGDRGSEPGVAAVAAAVVAPAAVIVPAAVAALALQDAPAGVAWTLLAAAALWRERSPSWEGAAASARGLAVAGALLALGVALALARPAPPTQPGADVAASAGGLAALSPWSALAVDLNPAAAVAFALGVGLSLTLPGRRAGLALAGVAAAGTLAAALTGAGWVAWMADGGEVTPWGPVSGGLLAAAAGALAVFGLTGSDRPADAGVNPNAPPAGSGWLTAAVAAWLWGPGAAAVPWAIGVLGPLTLAAIHLRHAADGLRAREAIGAFAFAAVGVAAALVGAGGALVAPSTALAGFGAGVVGVTWAILAAPLPRAEAR